MNKDYRSRRFSLSTGADVRNSSYVWYEDMMRDRYSVKTHLEECACAVRKELIKNNCLNEKKILMTRAVMTCTSQMFVQMNTRYII